MTYGLAWSPDGKQLAVAASDNKAYLAQAAVGSQNFSLQPQCVAEVCRLHKADVDRKLQTSASRKNRADEIR